MNNSNLDHPGCSFANCGKLRKVGSGFCPKHDLLAQHAQDELNKKMERARSFKEYKAQQRKLLETSPLRAFNPEGPR